MAHTLPPPASAGGSGVSPRLRDERVAAAYTGLSLSTIRRMRARRLKGQTGPDAGPAFVYVMSAVRYDMADLDAWIEALPRPGAGAEVTTS